MKYSSSALRILLPQGWQSQTQPVHVQMAFCIIVESIRVPTGRGGNVSFVMGALLHCKQRRRCRPFNALGAGGLMAQFCVKSGKHTENVDKRLIRLAILCCQLSRKVTHPANDSGTPAALGHHVSGAGARLAQTFGCHAGRVFYVVPISSSGTVSESVFRIGRNIFMSAAKTCPHQNTVVA